MTYYVSSGTLNLTKYKPVAWPVGKDIYIFKLLFVLILYGEQI